MEAQSQLSLTLMLRNAFAGVRHGAITELQISATNSTIAAVPGDLAGGGCAGREGTEGEVNFGPSQMPTVFERVPGSFGSESSCALNARS